jgi:5-methyltetrahydropteroyltriglutamate--homocysteine methyltransferase
MTNSQSITIRADTVGSLLRPESLHAARRRFAASEIDAASLRLVEDEAIAKIIAYQEDLGLPVVTDGEFRRENWWIDFVRRLEGVEIVEGAGAAFASNEAPRYVPKSVLVADQMRAPAPILVDDFRFVEKHSKAIAKIAIPSPTRLHFHGGRKPPRHRPTPTSRHSSPISRRSTVARSLRWKPLAAATSRSTIRC